MSTNAPTGAGEHRVRSLYHELLEAWNRRNPGDMAGLFAEDGNVVGFDGSQMDGRAAIEAELARIFADHRPAAYVGIVREVRFLSPTSPSSARSPAWCRPADPTSTPR